MLNGPATDIALEQWLEYPIDAIKANIGSNDITRSAGGELESIEKAGIEFPFAFLEGDLGIREIDQCIRDSSLMLMFHFNLFPALP